MKNLNKRKWIAGGVVFLVIAYLFIEFSIPQKFGRFITIMGNIVHNVQLPDDYGAYDISEDELNEINISKIAGEMKSSIDKEREAREALKPKEAIHEAARDEEVPTHTKTRVKAAKPMKLEDLPAKFKPLKQHLHEPFKMGACQICHIADASKPGALIKPDIANICYECHKTRYTKEFDHEPVNEGRCMDCHDPHQSDTPKLLKAPTVNALCLNCHDKSGTHKAKAKKKLISMQGAVKHKPAEKNCMECHDPHTASYKGLLKNDGTMNLCLDCHADLEGHKDMKAWVENARYKHGAVSNSKNKCLECHDPHATQHKGILKKDQVSMCLSCHNKSVKADEDGGMLLNIAQHLKENPNWHAPIKNVKKKGGCNACHEPHGSDNFSILRKSFTKNFYDNVDNEDFFCFECHDQEKVSKQYIMPYEEDITSFRDGRLNLHYLHVNDRKGRSCRACHDEHASKYSHLIRDYTDFTGVKFPLRFIETDNGGSCAPACHKKFEYDRSNPKSKVGIKALNDAL